MNRQAQAAVLFLLGAAVLHAAFTDLYLRYVKAGLRPLLILAGIVLIAAAVATVWYELRRPSSGREQSQGQPGGQEHSDERQGSGGYERSAGQDEQPGGHGDSGGGDEHPGGQGDSGGHGHAHREPRISWLLVLPLFALILVAPPALGSYSAVRTGTALQAPFGYPPLPAGDPLRLGLVDYAGRAAYDHGRSLQGRHVEITGFIALGADGSPYLVRMALNCCAADAQPVKIGLSGHIPPVLQPDAWLSVTGTYTARRAKDPVNGGVIPYLEVSEARPVPVPRDPYDESWNG
ncbi:TIGR03943 family putative permease subunit [Streptomyces sp. NPDC058274]|uniref:TIGR03943 family putative permease subunit n=1 Tax=Streptomyces sp. NPDC058274 TaxID=3346416 RepID=UPI0036E4DB7C